MLCVVSVNRARPKTVTIGKRQMRTGIFKLPVKGRVMVHDLGLEGDGVADPRYHGGPDKAVYAYPIEHYAYWAEKLARSDLAPGQFGENLTVEGLSEEHLRIGDRLAVGATLVLQVRDARIPCVKLAARMENPGFVKVFTQSLRCGFYLGVLTPGEVAAGDTIRWLPGDGSGETVRDCFARQTGRPTSAGS